MADLNGNGWLDILFNNNRPIKSSVNAYLYWGSAKKFSDKKKTEVPMVDTESSTVADLKMRRGFSDIRRHNGRVRARLVIETGDENQRVIVGRIKEALSKYSMPEGYTYKENKGEEIEKAMSEMNGTVLLAVPTSSWPIRRRVPSGTKWPAASARTAGKAGSSPS